MNKKKEKTREYTRNGKKGKNEHAIDIAARRQINSEQVSSYIYMYIYWYIHNIVLVAHRCLGRTSAGVERIPLEFVFHIIYLHRIFIHSTIDY